MGFGPAALPPGRARPGPSLPFAIAAAGAPAAPAAAGPSSAAPAFGARGARPPAQARACACAPRVNHSGGGRSVLWRRPPAVLWPWRSRAPGRPGRAPSPGGADAGRTSAPGRGRARERSRPPPALAPAQSSLQPMARGAPPRAPWGPGSLPAVGSACGRALAASPGAAPADLGPGRPPWGPVGPCDAAATPWCPGWAPGYPSGGTSGAGLQDEVAPLAWLMGASQVPLWPATPALAPWTPALYMRSAPAGAALSLIHI